MNESHGTSLAKLFEVYHGRSIDNYSTRSENKKKWNVSYAYELSSSSARRRKGERHHLKKDYMGCIHSK